MCQFWLILKRLCLMNWASQDYKQRELKDALSTCLFLIPKAKCSSSPWKFSPSEFVLIKVCPVFPWHLNETITLLSSCVWYFLLISCLQKHFVCAILCVVACLSLSPQPSPSPSHPQWLLHVGQPDSLGREFRTSSWLQRVSWYHHSGLSVPVRINRPG